MKHMILWAFLLSGLFIQGCDFVNNVRNDGPEDPEFQIAPSQIIATDVGLSSTIRVTKPEDYDPEKVQWKNTNPSVIELRDGRVFARNDGKASIIVSYEGKEDWKDTCRVEVKKGFHLVDQVQITPQRRKFTQVGQAVQLEARLLPENVTQEVSWKSLHPNIAEVSNTGRVTVLSQGKASIVASSYIDSTQTDTAVIELEVRDDYVFTAVPGLRERQRSFRYVLDQVKKQTDHAGFYLTPGNLDPINKKYKVFREAIGNSNAWYPVVDYYMLPGKGKEAEKNDNIKWLRNYFSVLPAITNPGPDNSPTTMYSFDYGRMHIVVINPFYGGITDINEKAVFSDGLYDWLRNDLEKYGSRYNFVASGVPAFPGDNESSYGFASENDRQQLWELLQKHGVIAYITGGNKAAIQQHDNIWQISTGNGQNGNLSFINVRIQPSRVVFEQYSGQLNGIFNKVKTQYTPLSDYM